MRFTATLVGLVGALGLVAGCSAPDPVFDNEGDQDVSCMTHQAEPPGERYTDPEQRDMVEVLTVLKYYTAHGSKPYCSGDGPTEADVAWGEFYVEVTGSSEQVPTVLG